MSSVFKGLGDFVKQPTGTNTLFTDGNVFIGQVMEVVKNTTTKKAGLKTTTNKDTPTTTGCIRFTKAGTPKDVEEGTTDIALPLDRGNYRLPFPGDQVLLTRFAGIYYYFHIVTQVDNVANTVDPKLMYRLNETEGPLSLIQKIGLDTGIVAKRFVNKNDFEEDTLDKPTGVFTKPREGDTILEGRMGGVIKLTHTITKKGVWDTTTQIVNIGESADGDPMMVIKANVRTIERNPLLFESDFISKVLEDDDINSEDSSFYLTSTQLVPLRINASQKMASWNTDIIKGTALEASEDVTARLQSLFPGEYSPSDVVTVNVNISGVTLGGGGGGGGGGFDGTLIQGGTWSEIAANFIAKKEGYTEVATWDVNHYRAGYGSDHIYKNGTLTVVTQGMTVTREEAIKTLADYSIPNFASQIAEDLGQGNWEKLNANQKAALTSLGYNVGKHYIKAKDYGKKIKDFIQAGDLQKAGETIFTDGPKYAGGKLLEGLVKRRQQESDMFLTPA